MDKKYEINNEINLLDANYENSGKREQTLTQEIQVTISELDSTRITKEDITKTFAQIEKNRNSIKKSLEEIGKKRDTATEKIKKYTENINTYETGVLSNLIKVDKKYETAIEMALGAALQNIVTDTEEDAKKLVEHLRKNNLGRATFLPITSVKGKKLEKLNDKGIDGVIGIAADLIKVNKKYEEVMLNLLGRTVIVENMDVAVKLAKQNNYSFKIVTIKGDIINPSGGITGGSIAAKTVNILGRAREIEDLEKELKKKKNTKKV